MRFYSWQKQLRSTRSLGFPFSRGFSIPYGWCALWIIGECCLSLSEVESGIATIKQYHGDLPFYIATEEGEATYASNKLLKVNSSIIVSSRRPVVLANRTYATQSAASGTALSAPLVLLGPSASPGNFMSLFLSCRSSCCLHFDSDDFEIGGGSTIKGW